MKSSNFRIKVAILVIWAVHVICLGRTSLSPAPVQTTIEILEGGRAELPCPVVNTSSSSAMTLVLWQRIEPGVLQPVYTIDARRQATHKHFPAPDLKGRARFDVASAILHLEQIAASDAGLYKCRVEFRRARTRTYNVLLKVIVPPREAVIMDEYGQHLRGIIGPYDEGFPLTLACEAEGGNPSPSVTWWRADQLLDASFELTAQGFARNELLMPELTRQDLMANLTCRVSNTDLSPPVESSVTLDVNLSPTEVHITSLRSPLRAGSETEVVCVAKGARPPARISWWLTKTQNNSDDQKTIIQLKEKVIESSSRDENLTVSTLTFVPKQDDHGSELSCKADNPLMLDSTFLQDNWTLHIRYPPRARISMWPTSPVPEGSSVTLICHIKANPPVTEVEWLLDGHNFEKWTRTEQLHSTGQVGQNGLLDQKKSLVDNRETEMQENRTLNLASVDPAHTGAFRCAATNMEGRSASPAIKLQVLYKPRCIATSSSSSTVSSAHGQELIFSIGKNDTVSVVCTVEANPPDVQFEWTLNGSPINSPTVESSNLSAQNKDKSGKSKRRESIINLSDLSAKEFGLLKCLATNILGRQKEPCVFRIVPSGPPEPLQRCSVAHNVTAHCLIVECESPPSQLNHGTRMEVLSDKDQLLAEVKSSHGTQPSFEVCSLPSGTSLLLLVYAEGTDGQYSTPLAIRTNTPAQQLPPSSRNNRDAFLIGLVIAMVAIICVTVITIAALIMVLRRRNRERQSGNAPTDENKSRTKDSISNTLGPDIIPVKGYLKEQINLQGLEKLPVEGEGPSSMAISCYDHQYCWSFPEVSTPEICPTSIDLLHGGGGGAGENGGGGGGGGGSTYSEGLRTTDGETPLVSSLPQVAQQWSEEGRRLSTPV